MPQSEGKRPITVVSACMKSSGTPELVLNQIEVTQDEEDNGIHYYLVEALLMEAGYEEPFVHFSESEAPAFLIPAVQGQLAPTTC
jgi:hypothetical protein